MKTKFKVTKITQQWYNPKNTLKHLMNTLKHSDYEQVHQ